MQTLLDCRSCSGFIPPGASACPCCGEDVATKATPTARISPLKAAFGLAATGLMAVSLMACYGLPMCDDKDKVDNDGDSYFKDVGSCYVESPDCDDTNPNVHPGADDPAGDGIDQNCDGADGIASTTSSGGAAGSTSSGGTGGTGGSTCTGGTGGTGGAPCGGTGGTM